MSNYADVLAAQERIKVLQRNQAALQSTIQTDDVGNLINVQSQAYIDADKELHDILSLQQQYQFNTNDKLRTIVTAQFDERLQEYVEYLLQRKDDLSLVDEIADLITEFPHLSPLFE